MNANRTTILGLFVLATIAVLSYYTLFLTDFALFADRPQLRVRFSETNGLREGDSVLVAGMRWGRVQSLVYDPKAPVEERITVLASLNEPVPLREGFGISIRDATLLGGRNLWIDPGPPDGKPVPEGEVLRGTVSKNPIEALGVLVSDAEAPLRGILENLDATFAEVRQGKGVVGRLMMDERMAEDLSSTVSSAARAMDSLEQLAADLRAGKGAAGRVLRDEALYEELLAAATTLKTTLAEVEGLAREARGGEGLVSALVNDPTLPARVRSSLERVDSIVKKVDEGVGTVGVLINDPTVADDLALVSGRLARGEGTVGALLTRPEVYEDLRAITEDIAVATAALRKGEGTIGRLVFDDDIYRQIRSALNIVVRSLEELREAAPITAFTNVFFSAL